MLWRGRPFLPPQAMPTGCLWTDAPLSSSSFDARYAAKAVIKTKASLRRHPASCRQSSFEFDFQVTEPERAFKDQRAQRL